MGVPLFDTVVLGNLCEYHHKSCIAKNYILWATFVSLKVCLALTSLTQLALNDNAFSLVTQNNRHYTVQSHSRSPISVPIESPHATSYN